MRTKFESNVRSLVDLQIALIGHQFDLQNLQPDKYFRGLSALETMLECAIMGHQTKAKAISKSLNVSTKMADKIEFRAMVELQDWDGIERFVRSKPKFNHKFAIDLLFSKGNAMKAAEYVNFLEVGSPMRKEVKEYHERWLATMKGKSLQ